MFDFHMQNLGYCNVFLYLVIFYRRGGLSTVMRITMDGACGLADAISWTGKEYRHWPQNQFVASGQRTALYPDRIVFGDGSAVAV